MPMGPNLIGAGIFTTIKLLGYSAAGMRLNLSFKDFTNNPVLFGLVRTVIGVSAGVSLFFGVGLLTKIIPGVEWIFFLALVPVRFAEWMLVMALFYSKAGFKLVDHWKRIVLCIMWSFILDIPAILSMFLVPVGFWVC